MNQTTKDFLRGAAQAALIAKDDMAAQELLAMLLGQAAAPQPLARPALPAARQLLDGPAHDYNYWAAFIRENFVPFMAGNGRLCFTSHELFAWLENRSDLALTTGDLEQHRGGREVWRHSVSTALGSLKGMGVLSAPAFGRNYEINPVRLPATAAPALVEGAPV